MIHVYSTMANANRYALYRKDSPNGINIVERSVLIKGGSGLNIKGIGTTLGAHTEVSDEDWEWLKDDFAFNQHIKTGYIRVEKRSVNPEKVAVDMVTRDQRTDACPVVPEDFSGKEIGNGLTALKPGKKSKAA